MTIRTDNALGLYLEGIRDGKPLEAQRKFTGHRYTQHSTGIRDGEEGFVEFFGPFLERNPVRDIRALRMLEDGRYVFCHIIQSLNDGESQWVTMDMFDTDTEGRIIEHWDVITAFAPETRSGADMIGGPDEIEDFELTGANKELVLEFTKQVRQEGHLGRIADFIAPDLVQHHPDIAAGRDGLADWLASPEAGSYDMLFKLIGQGNFAVSYGKRHAGGKDHADFDLYRIQNGLITEQWTCTEEILDRSEWGNSGKF